MLPRLGYPGRYPDGLKDLQEERHMQISFFVALGIQTKFWLYVVGVFSLFGTIFGMLAYAVFKEKRVMRELPIYAEKIGAFVPPKFPTFSSFRLIENRRRGETGRRVIYPSEFGDVFLFLYKYSNRPRGAPAGGASYATVLACSETFGLRNCNVTNSGWAKLANKIVGAKSENLSLESLIAGKRRCHLEVSNSGVMLLFNDYIYPPSAMSDLIFEFVELLQNLKRVADDETIDFDRSSR